MDEAPELMLMVVQQRLAELRAAAACAPAPPRAPRRRRGWIAWLRAYGWTGRGFMRRGRRAGPRRPAVSAPPGL